MICLFGCDELLFCCVHQTVIVLIQLCHRDWGWIADMVSWCGDMPVGA
jgi:hypothetical protein